MSCILITTECERQKPPNNGSSDSGLTAPVQAQIVPIMSVFGMVFTTAMGLVFGYIFRRTGNIIAPWLTYVLAGLTLVLSGAMTFVQYVE